MFSKKDERIVSSVQAMRRIRVREKKRDSESEREIKRERETGKVRDYKRVIVTLR